MNIALDRVFCSRNAGWLLAIPVLSIWWSSHATLAEGIRIEGEYRTSTVDTEIPRNRSLTIPFDETTNKQVHFGLLSDQEHRRIANLPRRLGPHPIGIHRQPNPNLSGDLAEGLAWQLVEEGWVGTVTVSSPEAKGVRLRLQTSVVGAMELTFFEFSQIGKVNILDSITVATESSVPTEISRHQAQTVKRNLWSPTANGNVIGLEILTPDARARDSLTVKIESLAHRFEELSSQNLIQTASVNSVQPIGASLDACENELAVCNTGSFSADAANATAKITFELSGFTATCSGTLVSDNVPGTQHFMLTAYHCVGTSASAGTVEAYWFYQPKSCSSTESDTRWTITRGGATLVKTYTVHDSTLLNLKTAPPNGAFYAGISTRNSIVARGSLLTSLHHSAGHYRQFYRGLVINQAAVVKYCDANGQNCSSHSNRHFTRNQVGIPLGGASGGGVFSGSNLVGVLEAQSEPSSCTGYSILNALTYFYSHLKPHLDPTPDLPVVSFDARTSSVLESSKTAKVGVSVSETLSSSLTVTFTLGGSADSTDYSTSSNAKSVTLGNNSTKSDISVTISNDNLHEGIETVLFTLPNGTDYDLGAIDSHILTIIDDDAVPTGVSLALSPTSIAESSGATDVTVTATVDGSSRWPADQIVSVSAAGSGKNNVVGFAAVSSFNLTIPKGADSGTAEFSITPTNDQLESDDEIVTVSGTLAGVSVSSAKLTLEDDDAPPSVVALSLSPTRIVENAGATEVTVTAKISGASRWTTDQTLPISVAGSGANNVVGFGAVSTFNVTISKGAGSGSAKFTITPIDDNFDTGNETVTVSGALTGVTVSSSNLTLTDDDTALSGVTLSLTPTSVSEGAGKTDITVTATIDGSSRWPADQTFPIVVAGSGANNVVGFGAVAIFDLTIASGTGSGTAKFSITPTNDSLKSDSEVVTVSGTLTGVSVSSANLTLTDDDIAPSAIALSLSPTSVSEGAGKTEVTVTATIDGTPRWGGDKPVSISVAESGTSNVVGFGAVSNFNLTIPKGAGSGSAKFSITPTNDNIDTSNETVTVNGTLTGVTVSPANLTLTDDDVAPSAVALSLSPTSVSEGGSDRTKVTVIATIDGSSRWARNQTLSISVAGSGATNVVRFGAVPKFNLSIPKGAGSGSAAFLLTPTRDNVDTGNETITISGTLTGVTVSPANLTLTDDDLPPSAIALSLSPMRVSEGAGKTEVTVKAVINGDESRWPTDQTLLISVSGSGASNVVGFAAVSNFNLTIAELRRSGLAKFSITPTNDNFDTKNETVTVSGTLAGVTVSPTELVLTDDDTLPTAIVLSLSPTSVSEGAGKTEVTVTATITGSARWATDQTLPISVTGSGTSDVVGFATVSNFNLTIPKGAASGTAKFSITPANDNFDSKNETVTVGGKLSGVSVSSANLTLTDDDTVPSVVALSLSPTSVSEGAGATEVTVTATIDGNARWPADQSIPISVAGSGVRNVVGFAAVSTFNLTLPKGAGSGTANFSITPTNDNFDTSNETVTVSGTLTGVSVNSASLTLTDDDTATTAIVLSLSPTSIAENAGETEVTVTATIGGTSRWTTDQTLPIAVAGSGASNVVGFTPVSDFNLTIPNGAGSGSVKFSITPTNDSFDNGNETVSVSSTLAGVAVSPATLTLTDDDTAPSAISLTLSPTSIAENAGETEVIVTATIGGTSRWTTDQTLPIAVAGSGASNVVGFTPVSDFNLTIPNGAGSGSVKFSITPTNDSFDNGNETVSVSSTLAGVAVSPATLTLTDDDTAPSAISLTLSPTSIAENAGETEVTVTATIGGTSRWTTDQTLPIAVAGSGASNVVGFTPVSDFNLTIPNGAGSGSIKFSITPTNDSFDNGSETVTVSGTLAGVAVSPATLTLTDDDTAPSAISLSLSPTSIVENAGATEVTVTATIGGASRWNTAQTVIISVDGSNSSNVVGFTTVSDFNLSIASDTGSASANFNLTPTNDSVNTNNETVTVSGTLSGVDVSSATLTLINDDQQIPNITISSDSAVTEGTAASFALSAAPLPNVPITVNISVSEDSIAGFVNASDLGSHTVVIPASGTVNHVMNTVSDNVDEPNGQVSVAISGGSGYDIGAADSALVNIIDNDATVVTISREDEDSISEDGGTETIRVQLSRQLQSGETVIAPLSIGGTNVTSSDYILSLADDAQLNAGVTMVTSGLHSPAQPAIFFHGNENDNVRTATLLIVAVDNDDDFASETLNIGFGSGNRSVSSNLDSFEGTGSIGTVTAGSVSIEITDAFIRLPAVEDQGDSRNEATLVDANSRTGGTIEEAGDVDYFRFTTAERGRVSVLTRSEFHIHCSLENVDGEVIESDDAEDGRCDIESHQEQGTFWVAIRGQEGATGTFTLIVSVEYEDVSDDVNTPHELAINTTYASQIESVGDVDHYVVTFEDGAEGTLQIYTLGSTDTHGCVQVDTNETDKEIWQCDDDGGSSRNFLLSIETSERERYLFRVSGHGRTTGRYVLAIEFHVSDDSEDNPFHDAPLIASTADNWIFSVHSLLDAEGKDAYEVRIPQVSRFVARTKGSFGMQIMLYRAPDLVYDVLGSDNAEENMNSEVAMNLIGGKYYVVVKSLNEIASGEYTLSLNLETFDSIETPTSL